MMIRQPIQRRVGLTVGLVSILLVISLYTFMSHRQHRINPNDKSIPTWKQMSQGVKKICTPHPRSRDVWLWDDSRATAARLFLGLTIAITIGLIIGMLGCLGVCEAFFLPILSFTGQIPPTAIMAVFFAFIPMLNQISPWTEEYNLYIAIIAFGLIPRLAQTTFLAIKDVPDELIYKSYTLGASHVEVALLVVFRHILPKLIDTIRLEIGPAMVYLIAAEMLCADKGFGYRIRLQSRLVNMDVVYPYLIGLAGFGFFMNYSLKRLQRWLCQWSFAKPN